MKGRCWRVPEAYSAGRSQLAGDPCSSKASSERRTAARTRRPPGSCNGALASALAAHPLDRIQPAVIQLATMADGHARVEALLAVPMAGDALQVLIQAGLQSGQIGHAECSGFGDLGALDRHAEDIGEK